MPLEVSSLGGDALCGEITMQRNHSAVMTPSGDSLKS